MPLLFCSAPFRCRSHLGYSLARLSELCPSLSSRVFAFAVRRVSARCRSFARLCFSLSMPVYALPCCALASPLRAVPFLCRAVPRLCTTVPCFANASRDFALPFRCSALPSLIRSCLRNSDSDRIQAVPLLCQLMLRYACAYSAFPMRGEARPISALAVLVMSFTDRRISAANQIVSSPGPFNSALRLCISIRNYTFLLRRLAARAFPQLSPW